MTCRCETWRDLTAQEPSYPQENSVVEIMSEENGKEVATYTASTFVELKSSELREPYCWRPLNPLTMKIRDLSEFL